MAQLAVVMCSLTRCIPLSALLERVRFFAILLAPLVLVGWCLWFYPFDDLLDRSGTPLGADFAMF